MDDFANYCEFRKLPIWTEQRTGGMLHRLYPEISKKHIRDTIKDNNDENLRVWVYSGIRPISMGEMENEMREAEAFEAKPTTIAELMAPRESGEASMTLREAG